MKSIVVGNGKEVDINNKKKEFIRYLVDNAYKYSDINQIILFGSCITDKCREDSDVDLVIIADTDKNDEEKIYENSINPLIHSALDRQETNFDHLLYQSYEKLEQSAKSVMVARNIINTGIEIYNKEWER